MDDLSGVPAAHLDQRHLGPVTTALVEAASSTSDPGGITGWLLHFNGTWAYVIVGLLAFAEAAFMVGFFFPGETAVVVGGVLAGLGRVNLGVMLVVAGPWLLQRRPPVFWRPDRAKLEDTTAVKYTLGLLERYGGPAVFLGRFIAFARVVIPGLAGMSGLRYRTFLFWNVLGGLCWGIGYTMLGYVVGVSFEHVLSQIGLWSLAVVAVLLAGVAVFEVRRRRRERRRIELELADLDQPADPAGPPAHGRDAGPGDHGPATGDPVVEASHPTAGGDPPS